MENEFDKLSDQDRVVIKHIWSKFLLDKNLYLSVFFEKLLYEEKELTNIFGESVEEVSTLLFDLFNSSIERLVIPNNQNNSKEYESSCHYNSSFVEENHIEEYNTVLTNLGMRFEHWITARRVWLWTLLQIPRLDEYDFKDREDGMHSLIYRFFTIHILTPILENNRHLEIIFTSQRIQDLKNSLNILLLNCKNINEYLYDVWFKNLKNSLHHFNSAEIEYILRDMLKILSASLDSSNLERKLIFELREIGKKQYFINLKSSFFKEFTDTILMLADLYVLDFSNETKYAWSILLKRVTDILQQPIIVQQRILSRAESFTCLIAHELNWKKTYLDNRLFEIEREIYATGTYTHTYEELAYGAQLSWRNSSKCVGRIAWRNMIVRDLRHIIDPHEMFNECVNHLRMAINGGNVQIVMNVFRSKKPMERWGPRIWNNQYIQFAAYEQADGKILGDKRNVNLTQTLIRYGWIPPVNKTAYDYLPIIIEVPGQSPKMYEFSPDDVMVINIEHPYYSEFNALAIKWYVVPFISNYCMEIGGINYSCVPFNGWFMETEITQNIWADSRYYTNEDIAKSMGIDESLPLWEDKAILELNTAVIHSFNKHKVSMVDHQTASRQFIAHEQRERRAGRECPVQGKCEFISLKDNLSNAFHYNLLNSVLSPNLHKSTNRLNIIEDELVDFNN